MACDYRAETLESNENDQLRNSESSGDPEPRLRPNQNDPNQANVKEFV